MAAAEQRNQRQREDVAVEHIIQGQVVVRAPADLHNMQRIQAMAEELLL